MSGSSGKEIGLPQGRRGARSVAFPYDPGPGAVDVGGYELVRIKRFKRVAG